MASARPTLKVIIAIAAAILCGTLVAVSVHVSLSWTAREQAARLSQVTATVIEPAVPEQSRPAIGQWTAADGTPRTGVIPAPPHQTTGTRHPVWTNESGQLTTPPKSPLRRDVEAVFAGTLVAAAITTILLYRPRYTGSGGHGYANDRYRTRPPRTPRCRCTPGHGRKL